MPILIPELRRAVHFGPSFFFYDYRDVYLCFKGHTMYKTFIAAAALSGALAVALGAFGAHALGPKLEAAGRMDTYETAVKYQFYHTLALLFIGLLAAKMPSPTLQWAGWLMIAGILIFSGSLYILCLTGQRWLGAITPIGGTAFIAAWILLLISALRQP